MTAFGKLEGTAGRLILLFHAMEAPFAPEVSLSIVERVIQIVKGYLVPAYRYTFGEVSKSLTFDRWVADYIIQYADRATVTLSEIKRSGRRPLEGVTGWTADQWVLNAMYNLEQVHWVARIDDGTQEHRSMAQWAINPRILEEFKDYRRKVIKAKQAMMDEIYNKQPANRPRPLAHGAGELNDE